MIDIESHDASPALFPRPGTRVRAFVCLGSRLIHIAYLDEFGHVGPYAARSDPHHNTSPVFGFAGFIMPADEVRGFGTVVLPAQVQSA